MQELAFAAEALAFDAKNYHAWAHRQALLAAFGSSSSSANSSSSTSHGPATSSSLWESELAFTDRLLREDLRNNSAWNQRFFVLARGRLAGTQAELNARLVAGQRSCAFEADPSIGMPYRDGMLC